MIQTWFTCIETPPSSEHLVKLQDTVSVFATWTVRFVSQRHLCLVGHYYSHKCLCVYIFICKFTVHTHQFWAQKYEWINVQWHKSHTQTHSHTHKHSATQTLSHTHTHTHTHTQCHQMAWPLYLMGRIILAPWTRHPTTPSLQFLCWGLTPETRSADRGLARVCV